MLFDTKHLLTRAPGSATLRRLAFVSDHASPLGKPGSLDCGGQNVYVANLARELAQSGYAIDIFTRRDAIAQKQVVQWCDNIRVVHVPAGPAHFVPKEHLLPYVDDFARFVTRFCRRQPQCYDLVHANFFMSGMIAQHLKQELGIPFVITFHALGHVRRHAQGAADGFPAARLRIEEELMRSADRIIAECPQDRLDMEQLYGAPSQRIDIAPCGFDPQELWPVPSRLARQKLGLAQGRFLVLQLGRMVPRKGIDTVIQGVSLLRRRHGIDAQLVIVGGDETPRGSAPSPECARLRALATDLGLRDQVTFAGRKDRNELRYYYSAADVFVTTPWYEPFGITPVEAMACARPVIGADAGGIKSTVVDGETGFLIAPRDPSALCDRLALLRANPSLARSMGDDGLRRAYQHYTWRAVAQKAVRIYAAALDGVARTGAVPNARSH